VVLLARLSAIAVLFRPAPGHRGFQALVLSGIHPELEIAQGEHYISHVLFSSLFKTRKSCHTIDFPRCRKFIVMAFTHQS
jgi:hypothetical protein